MSTIVHYECRNPGHLRGGSRRGIGGTVIHHGSVGYCDGVNVDGAHRWVPTGGEAIEYLYDGSPPFDRPGPHRARGRALVLGLPAARGKLLFRGDRGRFPAPTGLHFGVRLSDAP